MTNEQLAPTLDVVWFPPERAPKGVTLAAYVDEVLIGLNGLVVGDCVLVKDREGVYQRKYQDLKRALMSNECEPSERRRGLRLRYWKPGPWRITYATDEGSFGLTQDLEATFGQFDLLVRADFVERWETP